MRARTEILRIRNYAGRWTLTHKRLPTTAPAKTATSTASKPKPKSPTATLSPKSSSPSASSPPSVTRNGAPSGKTAKATASSTKLPSATTPSSKAPPNGSTAPRPASASPPADYITLSYGRLFDQWRELHASAAADLTFAAVSSGDPDPLKPAASANRTLTLPHSFRNRKSSKSTHEADLPSISSLWFSIFSQEVCSAMNHLRKNDRPHF